MRTTRSSWRQIAACAAALLGGNANAETIYVDDDAPVDGDGLSWNAAHRFLQDAIDDAVTGDTIRVAEGRYSPDEGEGRSQRDRNATFQLESTVELIGGFAGIDAKDPDERDVGLYETVLSGDLHENDGPGFQNNDENSYHVVTGVNTNALALLDGFTITGGNADGASPMGAGAYLTNAAITIRECRFVGNQAGDGGAGLFINLGAPYLIDCDISDNGAARGGAILARTSEAVLVDCRFERNDVGLGLGAAVFTEMGSALTIGSSSFAGNAGRSGRAIRNEDGAGMIVGCTFENNVEPLADSGGAALSNLNSSPVVVGCVFSGNRARFASGASSWTVDDGISAPRFTDCLFINNIGGATSDFRSNASYEDCLFIGNSAESGGAARSSSFDAMTTYTRCHFELNTAELGGAIASDGPGRVVVRECVFDRNIATYDGGAVWRDRAQLEIFESVIRGNIALARGGAVHVQNAGTSTIVSTLIDGNVAASGGGVSAVDTDLVIAHTTVAANEAEDAGGVLVDGGTVSVLGSILWGNTDPRGAEQRTQIDLRNSSAVEVDYSCLQFIDGSLGGAGNIGDDPLFVDPLGSDGVSGTADDDFHLLLDSPCVNTGSLVVQVDPAPLDFEGEERRQICRIDMGADETPYENVEPADCNDNGISDACDIFEGAAPDCNENGVPDQCDIGEKFSADCDDNGVPDECDRDCNGNGAPDACDILTGASSDCDGSGVPDECEVRFVEFSVDSGPLSPFGSGFPQGHAFESLPVAMGDVVLSLTAYADLVFPNRFVRVLVEGTSVGTVFGSDGSRCPDEPDETELIMDRDTFNDGLDESTVVEMRAIGGIDPFRCDDPTFISARITYLVVNDNDCNLNEILDICDLDSGRSFDCNENGIVDDCECPGDVDGDCDRGFGDVLRMLSTWGVCSDCLEDVDGDGAVGFGDILIVLANWGPCP